MTETLKMSLLSALFLLLASVPSSTAKCCPTPFNCDSFWTNAGGSVTDLCSQTSLDVLGTGGNRVSAVKSCYVLDEDTWFEITCVENTQCGIGASFLSVADEFIRYNDNSVGFYWDAETTRYGEAETPDDDGWNKSFSDRLVDDPASPPRTLAIKINYENSIIWYRHPEKAPIDFKLPVPFRGKPLYAHVTIWNSNSLTHDSGGECTCSALRGAFWAT